MGVLDWLFPSLRRLPLINITSDDDSPAPSHDGKERIMLKLVPKAFDPDGDDGDLMWFGCVIEDQYGSRYSHDDNRLNEAGFYVFNVAGVTHRRKELQHDSFRPPNFVALVKEDSNPYDKNAVSVWNNDKSMTVGYVPKEDAEDIRQVMADYPDARGLVLAHCLKKKRRVALTVLFGPLT
jgi:HIRAN domain-containing protein